MLDLHNYVKSNKLKFITHNNILYYINNGKIISQDTKICNISKDILLINIENLIPFSLNTSTLSRILNNSIFEGISAVSDIANTPLTNLCNVNLI